MLIVFYILRNKESSLSCVYFVCTKKGGASKEHTGWVSDPGENSLH